MGKIGINTLSPVSSFYINTRDAIRIPVGDEDNDKPTGEDGYIRYNSTKKEFEGFGNGEWSSFNSVGNIEGNVKLTVDNNEFKFFTGSSVDDQLKDLK